MIYDTEFMNKNGLLKSPRDIIILNRFNKNQYNFDFTKPTKNKKISYTDHLLSIINILKKNDFYC